MNYDSIFEQPEEKVEWVAFKNINDRVSGTYIDLSEDIDGYNNPQYVVTLLRDGVLQKFGIRKTHTWLVGKVMELRLGQLVGFVFTTEKPSGKGQPTKIIELKQVPTLIDEAWTKDRIASMARIGMSADLALRPTILAGAVATVAPAPVAQSPAAPVEVAPFVPVTPAVAPASSPVNNPVFDTVRALAVNKGLFSADATTEEKDAKIKEVTGYDVSEVNTTQIIVSLSSYVAS